MKICITISVEVCIASEPGSAWVKAMIIYVVVVYVYYPSSPSCKQVVQSPMLNKYLTAADGIPHGLFSTSYKMQLSVS